MSRPPTPNPTEQQVELQKQNPQHEIKNELIFQPIPLPPNDNSELSAAELAERDNFLLRAYPGCYQVPPTTNDEKRPGTVTQPEENSPPKRRRIGFLETLSRYTSFPHEVNEGKFSPPPSLGK